MITEHLCIHTKINVVKLCSGIATPWARAHVKFTSAQVKIMLKAKVKDQLLACRIACGCKQSIQR